MQTFLPYPNFMLSARVLDWRRLGKQRAETKQIIKALDYPGYGWQKHPAVKMWRGYQPALCLYGMAICHEWRVRGYQDTTMEFFAKHLTAYLVMHPDSDPELGGIQMPPWFGDHFFHESHRSQLLAKDLIWYSRWRWTVEPGLPYVWPDLGN